MNEKDILIAFLGATLNLPSDKIAETLYKKSDDGTITEEIQEGALDALKAFDKERIGKVKPDTGEFFNNGYKKAQLEVSERLEKTVRERFGLSDKEYEGLKGDDLITAALEKVAKPKLDDEKVKMHPLFISREKELLQMVEAAKTEGVQALEEFKGQQTKAQRIAAAQARAKDILLNLKPNLEEDQRIADRRIKNFLNEFSQLEYEEVDGELIPIKDGKRLENEHFHPVPFETLVKTWAAENFTFPVQDPKGATGSKNAPGPTNTNNVPVPKNEEEMARMYAEATTYEQKKAIMEAYEKANGEIRVG